MVAVQSPPLVASPGFNVVSKNTFLHIVPELDQMSSTKQQRRSRCYSDLTGDMEKADYRDRSPSQLSPILSPALQSAVARELSPVSEASSSAEHVYPWTKSPRFVPGQSLLHQVSGMAAALREPEGEPGVSPAPSVDLDQSVSEPDRELSQSVGSATPPTASRLRLTALKLGSVGDIVMDGFDDSDAEEQPGTPCYLDQQPVDFRSNRFASTGPNPFTERPNGSAFSPPQALSPTLANASPLQQVSMVAAAQLGFATGQQLQTADDAQPVPQIPGLMPNFQLPQGVAVVPIMPMLFPACMQQQMQQMQMQMQQMQMQQMMQMQMQPQERTKADKQAAPKKAKKEPRVAFQPPPRDPSVPIAELTLMLKNIPNKYKPDVLLEELKEWRGFIDFFYMPIDFKNNCNLGYAFVNFHDVAAAERFRSEFHAEALPLFPQTGKVVQVSEARVQGKDAYVERFRNSSVMADGVLRADYKPLLFDKTGAVTDFPAPDGELPALGPRFRRQR